MEKTKIVKIDDFGNTFVFRISLFKISAGLSFMDKLATGFLKKDLEAPVTVFAKELLPLAAQMDLSGEKVISEHLSLDACEDIFDNPLSVIELCKEILEHQKVFFQNSQLFQGLATEVSAPWLTKIMGLTTQ